jgi:CelD/BcsL family acetyltransferase involved in cellulose biosynthesis
MPADVLLDFRVEEISTVKRLGALHPAWMELWARCRTASPFQHPAWLASWWLCFGGDKLMLLTFWKEGRLAGLAPLFIWNQPDTRERTVLLGGTGITDYNDVLFEPGFEAEGSSALFDYLYTERFRWDTCDFQQLPDGSHLLRKLMPSVWFEEQSFQDSCPVLKWESHQRIEDVVPAGHLKQLAYYRRRTEKLGRMDIERVDTGNFEELFTELLRLHRMRWQAKGEPGMLADPQVQQFHREAASRLLEAGMLRLFALRLNEEVVAVYYGMSAHRRSYFYLSGYDPAHQELSLGMQLVGYAIEQAFAEGGRAFDFLRGREPYKYVWGARDQPTYRRRLAIGREPLHISISHASESGK